MGDTTTARRVCAALRERGQDVEHLLRPGHEQLTVVLTDDVTGVAILLHQDEISLQYAVAVAHAAPALLLVVEDFDATVSSQLERLLDNCLVTSPGRLAAPVLAAACVLPVAERGGFVDEVLGGFELAQQQGGSGGGTDSDRESAGVVVLDDLNEGVVDLHVIGGGHPDSSDSLGA